MKKKKIKKIFLPSVSFAFPLVLSTIFGIGVLFGYFWTNYFHKKIQKNSRIKAIVLKIGELKIHLHHWLIGVLVFFLICFFGLLDKFSPFYIGCIFGFILHDIWTDRQWHKIFVK